MRQRSLILARLTLWTAALAQNPVDAASPADPPDHHRMIDAIFAKWDRAGTPGAAVAVVHNGTVVFEKGYGIANLEYDMPIGPRTIFHVSSVSKQFTAMAVVLLEGDGKLSLEDDIHQHLPELPGYGHKLTVRNLLQHTSGIRDQWQLLALSGWTLEDVITQDQILRLLFRQKELNFPPGTEMLYSNAGYTLLAEIVARVSGRTFPTFCTERIFEPLGMTRTHFHQDLTQVVPQRAYSYHGQGGEYAASPLNYANVGATGLFTTAGDLAKWLDNFRDPKVGGQKAIARLQERAVLSNGKKTEWGLGIGVGTYRGVRMLSHDGADAGYRSVVLWFPDQNLGVAVISNLASFKPGAEATRVAAVYLGDTLGAEPPTADGGMKANGPPPGAVNESTHVAVKTNVARAFAPYEGAYWNEELETQYRFVVKNENLVGMHVRHGEIALTPLREDEFSSDRWFMRNVKFVRDGAKQVTAVLIGGGRVREIRFVRKASD